MKYTVIQYYVFLMSIIIQLLTIIEDYPVTYKAFEYFINQIARACLYVKRDNLQRSDLPVSLEFLPL